MDNLYTYGYTVLKSSEAKFPLHVVEISHPLLAAFSVFSSARDASEYIAAEKKRLDIKYDPDFWFSTGLIHEYTRRGAGNYFSKIKNRQIYRGA